MAERHDCAEFLVSKTTQAHLLQVGALVPCPVLQTALCRGGLFVQREGWESPSRTVRFVGALRLCALYCRLPEVSVLLSGWRGAVPWWRGGALHDRPCGSFSLIYPSSSQPLAAALPARTQPARHLRGCTHAQLHTHRWQAATGRGADGARRRCDDGARLAGLPAGAPWTTPVFRRPRRRYGRGVLTALQVLAQGTWEEVQITVASRVPSSTLAAW